ncbi:AzlC family ABC transporter permease [Lacibacterium aquatile]|uniref:AzlC family ABC transporter permease n=1 Tax=Lacibacterium aquatile TaxID=1168082 RepID=A0ABW5DS83_9PROT
MSETVEFTLKGGWRGAKTALQMVLAYIPWGGTIGVLAQANGLSFAEAMLMSALMFAGSAQVLALSIWVHPLPFLALTISTFSVNLRFALMGPVLAPWFDKISGWRLWGSLFVLADQNWALSVAELRKGGRDAGFMLGSGIILWTTWVVVTGLGYQLGAVLKPEAGHPAFFAALAVFCAMLVTMWRGLGDLLPWVTSGIVAIIVSKLLPGTSWHIVIGAISGCAIAILRDNRKPPPAKIKAEETPDATD